jgi:hypothetical protein
MSNDKPKSKIIPNTFQTPNAHVDQAMRFLSGDEYKVLNFAVRHIYGWQDRHQRYKGRISLSVFVDGFTTEEGARYYGCGLRRATIVDVLHRLVAFGLLVQIDEATKAGRAWDIGTMPDWDALSKRYEQKQAVNQTRRRKMMDARITALSSPSDEYSGPSHDTSPSDEYSTSPSDETLTSPSHDTHIKPCESHSENHDSNASAAQDAVAATAVKEKKSTTPKAVLNPMCEAIVDALGWDRPLISKSNWSVIRTAAKQLIEIGTAVEEVIHLKRECDARQYRGYSALAFAKVAPDVLPRIRQTQTPAPAAGSGTHAHQPAQLQPFE